MRGTLGLLVLAACDRGAGGLAFDKRVIDPAFRAEGVAVFDVDRDGHLNLVTEELWYAGPAFDPHPLREPRAWDPLTEYASSFGAFHLDVDGDGWDDLVTFHFPGQPASWCRNPGARDDPPWDCHDVAPAVWGESPLLTDAFGAPALVVGTGVPTQLGWLAPGAVATEPWPIHALTPADFPQSATFGHGMGLGDVDGDGRLDLVTGVGWFAQPADPAAAWPFHAVDFCPNNCSHMFVDDLDGDGRPDVLGASPHNYGASWWQQQPGGGFLQHEIDREISQNHAARYVDLDGDGSRELVTGKRYWAHEDRDPGAYDPVLLVAYRHRVEAGEVRWDRIQVDDDSGVGSHNFEVVDVDGDGKLDLVTSTKKGLFLFHQD